MQNHPSADPKGVSPSLESLAAAFLADLAEHGDSPRTVKRYGTELRAFLAWLAGREVTEGRLHAYRRYLQTERPNKSGRLGLRPRTIRLAFTALFRFVDWLAQEHDRRELPRRGCVPMPALDTPQREVPTPAEVDRLFEAAERVGLSARTEEYRAYQRARAYCVLSLLANCGLRLAELLALNASDLRRDRKPWLLHVREGKGAQTRWVPVNDEAQRHIGDWLAVRAWWVNRYHRTTDRLFPVGVSQNLGERGLYNLFRELKRLAGLEERLFTPHGMRHAFADRLLEVTDVKTIQALMGHKSAQTTIEVYLHTSQARMEQAVADLGKRTQERQEAGPDLPPDPPAPPAPEPPRESRAAFLARRRRQPPRGR